MRLHIFEPRYRLLVRRAMEGSRRLGMAAPAAGGSVAPIASKCTPPLPVVLCRQSWLPRQIKPQFHLFCAPFCGSSLVVPAVMSQVRCTLT